VAVGRGSDSELDDIHAGFMSLAKTMLPASYRLAVHILGDRSDGEDAVQEALVLAWRGWPRLRDRERFAAWFDRILVNVCYERLRGRKRRSSEALSDDLPARSDPFASAIAADAVGRALLRLTPEQRIVIVLRYWRDLSMEEIAERVGVPSGTVRSRLHYAIKALKAELDPARAPALEADR
jgi:RNA polymerase sigma-70 factor, ECF subfamily